MATVDEQNNTPIPDPTALTDVAIAKAMTSLTQYVDGQLQVRDAKLDGNTKAMELFDKVRWEAHESVHNGLAIAIDKADDSQKTALKAALDDHHREHTVHEAAHDREHSMNAEAIKVAGLSMDKRLEGLNQFREQLREQAEKFASSEKVDSIAKDFDRRITDAIARSVTNYEDNRLRIEKLEKGDVQQQGRGMGQSSAVSTIIAAISVSSVIIGIIVVLANAFITGG